MWDTAAGRDTGKHDEQHARFQQHSFRYVAHPPRALSFPPKLWSMAGRHRRGHRRALSNLPSTDPPGIRRTDLLRRHGPASVPDPAGNPAALHRAAQPRGGGIPQPPGSALQHRADDRLDRGHHPDHQRVGHWQRAEHQGHHRCTGYRRGRVLVASADAGATGGFLRHGIPGSGRSGCHGRCCGGR